jgi:20S proteasome subunit alpha 2
MQEATQSAGVRPYGVSLLVAGWDEGIEPEEESKTTEESEEKKVNRKTGGIHKGGPMLYQVDPSGSYYPWKATAIGKSATKAKTFLEKRYSEELELEDAIHIALLTLKDNIEGEMNGDSIEIGKFSGKTESENLVNILQVLLVLPQTISWDLRVLMGLLDPVSES